MMADALKAFKADTPAFPYALVPRFKGHRGHPLVLSPMLARAIVRDKVAVDLVTRCAAGAPRGLLWT